MSYRWPTLLLALLSAPLLLRGAAAEASWSNYRGKAEINISAQDLHVSIQVEQLYRRQPEQMLLRLEVFGLKQTVFMDGNVEKTYRPAQGVLIETRYLNLDKAAVNPMLGTTFGMETVGRQIREAKSATTTGTETLLGTECDRIELDTHELLQRFGAPSLLGNPKLIGSLAPRAEAWISRDWGIPLQLQLSSADGKPALTFKFTELQVDSDAVKDGLQLSVPEGTRRVSLTVDLADPNWESRKNAEVKRAFEPRPAAPENGGANS